MKITRFKSAQFATYGMNFDFSYSSLTIEISFFDWAIPARFSFDPLGWRTCAQFFCLNFAHMHFEDLDDAFENYED